MEKIFLVSSVVLVCLVIYLATNKLHKYINKKSKNIRLIYLIKTIQILSMIFCVGYVLNQFEVTKEIWSSVLTNISLIVVVLGFAAQESIRNILSGYMVASSKVFNIGQRVTLVNENITGIVTDITSRHVTIKKPNNTMVIVPNSVINNAIIENSSYTDDGVIANYLDIDVAYESDVKQAIEIIK